jgi:hypothetical protein
MKISRTQIAARIENGKKPANRRETAPNINLNSSTGEKLKLTPGVSNR